MRAVDGVSLDIGAGEVLGLVGESGCGKSTLGRGILGLLPEGARADGEVLYGGRNLVDAPAEGAARLRGPELGLIFQEPMTRLNPLLRIADHFEETLEQHEPELSDGEIAQPLARDARPDGHPADALPPVPARVLGRHAAADHDRARARAAAEAARRRRADDRRST